MKLFIHVFLLLFLLCTVSVSGQKTPDDSLSIIIKKANQEIYNNPDNVIKIGEKLLKKEKDTKKLIRIYLLLSTAGFAKRDFDESLKYIYKARELAKKTNDPKIQTSVLMTAAMQFQQMDLLSKSLETLDEVDKYLAELPEDLSLKHFETARSFALRGMIYKSQANPEIALQEFLIAIKNFKKVPDQKTTFYNQSIIYYNIGACYITINEPNEAQKAFQRSIDIARLIKANSLEAFALKGMSEIPKQKHQYQAALDLLLEAEKLSKNIGDLTLNEGIYKEMADNYLAMGKQNLYQIYSKKYLETRLKREQNELSSINHALDIHNLESQKKSKDMITRYHIFILATLLSGAFVFGLFFYFVLKIRKRNQRDQEEIKKLFNS
ncbi:tetratricopeptide repeat protein [Chryseobacterium sp. LC2016-29]|uniref:tetratricopeptide repeat protein n=1 Tax=Chryseobacterium sp. LC2016-29 TaxID=2897331 RepID=UPI001E49EE22|nr:tetratricopeptide repeat protein [Chryseobacterium sp. LC2016-29]MCD0479905.1 tetratricopeptide repeat protein [Chryseobacterium sp. LC2016-29]